MCMMNVNCTLEVSIQEFTHSVHSNVVSLAATQIHCVVVDNVLCKLPDSTIRKCLPHCYLQVSCTLYIQWRLYIKISYQS